MHVSRRTIRNWLHKIGYKQKEGKKGFAPIEQRMARTQEYMIPLVKVHAREREEAYVLVFTRELHLYEPSTNNMWFADEQQKRPLHPKGGAL